MDAHLVVILPAHSTMSPAGWGEAVQSKIRCAFCLSTKLSY